MNTLSTELFPPAKSLTLTENAPAPLGAYAHVVEAGPFLYLCGLGARDAETGEEAGLVRDSAGEVISYDITRQTHVVFDNMKTVLAALGCDLSHVIDVTVFLATMDDFQAYNSVYAGYFDQTGRQPARTTIEARPPGYNYIEMKAVAYRPGWN